MMSQNKLQLLLLMLILILNYFLSFELMQVWKKIHANVPLVVVLRTREKRFWRKMKFYWFYFGVILLHCYFFYSFGRFLNNKGEKIYISFYFVWYLIFDDELICFCLSILFEYSYVYLSCWRLFLGGLSDLRGVYGQACVLNFKWYGWFFERFW